MRPLPARVLGENALRPVQGQRLMTGLVIFLSICAILYFGQDILIPTVLAILLSLLLAPGVRFLQRLSLPKPLAVSLMAGAAFAILLAGTAMMATSLTRLAGDLPRYETNLRAKAQSLKLMTSGSGTIEKAANVLKDLQTELTVDPASPSAVPAEVKPIPVEVRESGYGPLAPVISVIGMLVHPITQLGIVILMVFFILFNREDLRNRLIRLAGTGDIHRTTLAIDEAARRLSRLFSTQLLINAATGAFVGIVLSLLGVPGGILWGVLTAVLRFIPYVGTPMSAIFPIIIAAGIGDGWTLALLTAGVVLVTELIVGQIVEPLAFGKMTGLSATAIVAAAAFWTALWGPVGLILATPLTIGVLVIGRHIEALNFLEVLLGSEPVLSSDRTFYQRMLAGDPMEAAEQAADYEKNEALDAFLSEVAVPGLLLAQQDQQRGVLSRDALTSIAHTFSEALDEIWSEAGEPDDETAPVILVAAHGALNFAATLAYSAYLTERSVPHRMLGQDAIQPGKFPDLAEAPIEAVCLCYLSAPSEAQHAYVVRRLKAQIRDAQLLSVAWSGAAERQGLLAPANATALLPSAGAAAAVSASAPSATQPATA